MQGSCVLVLVWMFFTCNAAGRSLFPLRPQFTYIFYLAFISHSFPHPRFCWVSLRFFLFLASLLPSVCNARGSSVKYTHLLVMLWQVYIVEYNCFWMSTSGHRGTLPEHPKNQPCCEDTNDCASSGSMLSTNSRAQKSPLADSTTRTAGIFTRKERTGSHWSK